MNVLVTGASGMIGTRLCQILNDQKIAYVGLDRQKNRWDERINSKLIKANLLDKRWDGRIHSKITHIVHLAANARVTDSIETPSEALENMQSTFAILEYARRNNIRRIIFASSKEVYGTVLRKRLRERDVSLDKGENPYCASKVAGEALFSAYGRCYGIESIILRFSNVYGPFDRSARAVPEFIRRCMMGERLTVYGERKKLDFVHSDDVCQAILLSLKNFKSASGTTCNIAFGRSTTLYALAKMVQKKLNKRIPIDIRANRVGEILEYTSDITLAKSVLGYAPKVSLSQGIADTVAWFRQHPLESSTSA